MDHVWQNICDQIVKITFKELKNTLEFTIAQSPHEMRGFMVGMWFAAFAIGLAVNINGKYPFKYEGDIICQNLFYYVYNT